MKTCKIYIFSAVYFSLISLNFMKWTKGIDKLWCSNLYIFAIQCRRPYIFQNINSVRSNNLSLKCLKFSTSGWTDIGIRKFEFVAKTQLLCLMILVLCWSALLITVKVLVNFVEWTQPYPCVNLKLSKVQNIEYERAWRQQAVIYQSIMQWYSERLVRLV